MWTRLSLLLLLLLTGQVGAVQTNFEWAGADYPPGVTYEFYANECSQTGIVNTFTGCDLADPSYIYAGVRAVPPVGAQCGDPPQECGPSAWTTQTFGDLVLFTFPGLPSSPTVFDKTEVGGGGTVTAPAWQEGGTIYDSGVNQVNSGSTVISNVNEGDYVIVQVQREAFSAFTGLTATGFTAWTELASVNSESNGFEWHAYIAQATSTAASRTITAGFGSNNDSYLSISSDRYDEGDGLVSLTPLDVSLNPTDGGGLASSSTSRGSQAADLTVASGKTALLLAFGTDWNDYHNHTGANSYTARRGTTSPSVIQFLYDRVVTAGTYGGTGTSDRFGTTSGAADNYMAGLVALEVNAGSGSASLLPNQLNAIVLQAVNASVR